MRYLIPKTGKTSKMCPTLTSQVVNGKIENTFTLTSFLPIYLIWNIIFMSSYWHNVISFLQLSRHCYIKYILNYIKILF